LIATFWWCLLSAEAKMTQDEIERAQVGLGEKRRAEIVANFRRRGFKISVPKPNVSNTTLKRWRCEGRELFYRPATDELGYAAWMTAHGQARHWTVADEVRRATVDWEGVRTGYWFTTEIAPVCPRLNEDYYDLVASTKLLSLEEYALVYWTHRDLAGIRIDVRTVCWIRTRVFRMCHVAGCGGRGMYIAWVGTDSSLIPVNTTGGRAVEVVIAEMNLERNRRQG